MRVVWVLGGLLGEIGRGDMCLARDWLPEIGLLLQRLNEKRGYREQRYPTPRPVPGSVPSRSDSLRDAGRRRRKLISDSQLTRLVP